MSEPVHSLSDQDRATLRGYLGGRLTVLRLTRDLKAERAAILPLLAKAGGRFRFMDATLKLATETEWTYSPAVAAAEAALEALKATERASGLATAATSQQLTVTT